jgi:hypothetical protein
MKGGDDHMMFVFDSQRRLADERIASLMKQAAIERLDLPDRPSIRRSVGNSIIRIGERLAAEPPMQPARFR